MTEPIAHPEGQRENPTVRHERTDASFRAIILLIAGALVAGVVIFTGVYFFFRGVTNAQANIKKSPYPLAPGPSIALPREPRLEQIDRLAGVSTPDVYEREASRLKVLNSYGPTKEEGFMHVPIDRAMRFLENKLPARAEPSVEQKQRSGGLLDAGEPNSGRMFRGRSR